jgi:hypothetical protein
MNRDPYNVQEIFLSLSLELIFHNNTRYKTPLFSIVDYAVSYIPAKPMGQHLVLGNTAFLDTVCNIKYIENPPEICLLENLNPTAFSFH